ncbi:hypothetical protein M3J09_005000 [Ascochyta lentis]
MLGNQCYVPLPLRHSRSSARLTAMEVSWSAVVRRDWV